LAVYTYDCWISVSYQLPDARLQQIICVGAEIQAIGVAVGIDPDATVQGIYPIAAT
jgi:hypothetical protein